MKAVRMKMAAENVENEISKMKACIGEGKWP
jgi:hypothetical protein